MTRVDWNCPGVTDCARLYRDTYGERPAAFINALREALGKSPILDGARERDRSESQGLRWLPEQADPFVTHEAG